MIKNSLYFLIVSAYLISCKPNGNSTSENKYSDCPFKKLESNSTEVSTKKGVQHNLKAFLKLGLDSKVIKIGEALIDIGDSVTIIDFEETIEKQGITYNAEQIAEHNTIVSTLCMKYTLLQDSTLNPTLRSQMKVELNEMVSRYFDLLVPKKNEQTIKAVSQQLSKSNSEKYFDIQLIGNSKMSKAKVLVDGKSATLLKNTPLIKIIRIQQKNENHQITLLTETDTCITDIFIHQSNQKVFPCQ